MANKLFYDGNLHVLRRKIASDSVDLLYMGQPSNSEGKESADGQWMLSDEQAKFATGQLTAQGLAVQTALIADLEWDSCI